MIRVSSLLSLPALLLAAGIAEGQSWKTMESARQLLDDGPTEVRIEYGAGELRVEPAPQRMLYHMELRYDEDRFTPITSFDAQARTLRLGLDGREHRATSTTHGSRAVIGLTREAPLDLALEFGAGEASLDLGGMSIRSLEISTGASETEIRFDAPNRISAERVEFKAGAAELEVFGLGNARARQIRFQGGVGSTTLDFSGAWDADATASVQMGIGELTLRFPRGLAVRLEKNALLTSFDTEGLIKRDDAYFSPDWDTATHRLTIDVDAAFGSVEVEWID
jgi:hypothetical protein